MSTRLISSLGVHRIVRRLWREVGGYNAIRRERIAKRKLARIYDDAERKLEALKEQATGVERIRYINDLYWVRFQRTLRGV